MYYYQKSAIYYTCSKILMKIIIFSSLFIILFSIPGKLVSQDAAKALDKVYGLDQTLYNGKKYNYFLPPGIKGDQYLISPDYFSGSLTLKGKCYQNIILNYDIFNQQLLLKYEDERGALNIIEVSKAWIESFRLDKMNFEFLNLDNNPHYYQVLGVGRVRIFYYWRKNMKLEATIIGTSGYVFTPAIRDTYVYMDGKLKPYNNKRSLIRLFDPVHRAEIKSYLRKNKVKVKKSSDQVITGMITFIGNIK